MGRCFCGVFLKNNDFWFLIWTAYAEANVILILYGLDPKVSDNTVHNPKKIDLLVAEPSLLLIEPILLTSLANAFYKMKSSTSVRRFGHSAEDFPGMNPWRKFFVYLIPLWI